MRGDGIVKPSALQGLCLFCACRFTTASAPPPASKRIRFDRTLVARRHVSSSRPLLRPFGVAPSEDVRSTATQEAQARLIASERAALADQEGIGNTKVSSGSGTSEDRRPESVLRKRSANSQSIRSSQSVKPAREQRKVGIEHHAVQRANDKDGARGQNRITIPSPHAIPDRPLIQYSRSRIPAASLPTRPPGTIRHAPPDFSALVNEADPAASPSTRYTPRLVKAARQEGRGPVRQVQSGAGGFVARSLKSDPGKNENPLWQNAPSASTSKPKVHSYLSRWKEEPEVHTNAPASSATPLQHNALRRVMSAQHNQQSLGLPDNKNPVASDLEHRPNHQSDDNSSAWRLLRRRVGSGDQVVRQEDSTAVDTNDRAVPTKTPNNAYVPAISDFDQLLQKVAPRPRPLNTYATDENILALRSEAQRSDKPYPFGNTDSDRSSEGRTLAEIAARTLRSRRFGGRVTENDDMSIKRSWRRHNDNDDRLGRRGRSRNRDFQDFGEDGEPARRSILDRDDLDELDPEAIQRRAERAAQREKERKERRAAAAKRAAAGIPISLPGFVTVSVLAQLLRVNYDQFISKMNTLGFDDIFASKVLDLETAALVAQEYGYNPSQEAVLAEEAERDVKPLADPEPEDVEYWPIRPPVVTIMGHVDHGKTTILDYLRKANVAAGEAGGITQHIGAFSVVLPATGRPITFLDTPGHAAFLAMRQRGANVTDIVVLVVAADDSVKPQTLEALKHARAAQVPIIVAINKIDRPEANIERVKQDLSRHGVEIEDFGGDVQVVGVSGKTGQGIADLEEAIVTQSELLDHRADTEGSVDGWVLEATTKNSGRVATVLVRRGTIRPGCILVAGRTWTRVRVLRDDTGAEVSEAPPGTPVEVDGWRDQPTAGDRALQLETEQRAQDVVDYRKEVEERKKLAEDTEIINQNRLEIQSMRERAGEESSSTENVKADGHEGSGQQRVPLIIRADVSGSAEAVAAYVEGTATPLVAPKILHSLVGSITESDIELAAAAQGYIIAFNLTTDERIRGLAASEGVRILENNIIYRVIEDVREILQDKLPRVITQKVLGEAEIAQAFDINVGGRKTMKIAGCKIRNGVVTRNSRVRVMRGTAKIYDGTLSSLKNVKKDVVEMRKGTECGMGFTEWSDFQPADLVQTYEEISERRPL